jgi:formylglycine-generating enzyme required for sulfatase activity
MKQFYQGYKYLIWAGMLALPSLAFAGAGDGKGNGGSPVLLRTKLIREYINTELRNDALAYMSNLQLDAIASPTAQKALKRMLEKDILTDIRTSSYVLQTSCKAIGGQDAGGAINGDLGGDICLSPKALAELDSTKAEIVGLAIHEHAHHFGYEDKDYAIYKAVYQTVWLSNPAWSDADPTTSPGPIPQPLPEPPVLGMNFVKLGPASFWMGSPQHEAIRDRDEIQHLVYLSRDFEIQTTDVTQAQYIKVMGNNPSRFQERRYCPESFTTIQGVTACPNHPVERVSFDDAQNFISRLNSMQLGRYFYRLPTEAEWEFAARGGSQTAYSFGSDPGQLDQYGWFDGNSGGQTHAVASLKPNAYGLYDMHGNVWQWVQDRYGEYPQSSVTDPQGPSLGSERVFRGGSWDSVARHSRSANRGRDWFDHRGGALGFRLVRTR